VQPSTRSRSRRLCWLAALMGLTFVLGACGAESDSDSEPQAARDGDQAAQTTPEAELGDLETLPTDTERFCGDQPIRLAQVDGFGANSWRKIVRAELQSELKPCTNVEISYAQAGGDIQKFNTQINSFVAQGYDIILVYDDFGEQGLPAIKKAHDAGVVIVPYISNPGGTEGEDYAAFVDEHREEVGKTFAEWLNKTLDGKGNVIFMGGIPGNPSSLSFMEPTVENTDPGIKWLQETPVDTNWDPAQYTRVTAGLISKYPQIDAIVSDYGAASVGQLRAYENAGEPHPPMATLASSNELGCMWVDLKDEWPDFEMVQVEGTTRVVRWAARRALATFNEIPIDDPKLLKMFPFVDTTAGREPECREDLPPDADLSSGLTEQELQEVFG
jgi:ribose transport system substrate-binding protein